MTRCTKRSLSITGDASVNGWPHGGALVAFADALLRNFDVPPPFNVTGSFATAESMRKLGPFTTEYTGCVHDVSIGNYDLCAVDTWMLPERMKMSDFLPPFDSEQFYLMVPDQPDDQLTFLESITRTFLPFTGATWGVVIAFLVGSLLIYVRFSAWFWCFSALPFSHFGSRVSRRFGG